VQASGAQRQAADAERAIGSLEERLTATQRQEAAAKAVLDAQRRAQRSGELLSSADMREITQPILNPPVDGAPEPQAAAGGGLFGGLFGAPKAKPQEVVEEVVEEVQEEVVTKARGGFGGLFAGIGKPAAKEVRRRLFVLMARRKGSCRSGVGGAPAMPRSCPRARA